MYIFDILILYTYITYTLNNLYFNPYTSIHPYTYLYTANFEEQALMSGEEVPWRNDQYDNKMPDEVVGERVKRIGGSDDGMPQ